MKRKKKINYPERDFQKKCVNHMLDNPIDGLFWTAINPISRKPIHIASLCKSMGMLAGIPDMLFLFKGRVFFVEFKASNGSLKDSQKQVFPLIEAQGINIYIAKSLGEFIEILKKEVM